MDLKDFEGLTKFKLIIPGIYILSWIGFLFGPSFFPYVYDKLMLFALIYGTITVIIFLLIMFKVTI